MLASTQIAGLKVTTRNVKNAVWQKGHTFLVMPEIPQMPEKKLLISFIS